MADSKHRVHMIHEGKLSFDGKTLSTEDGKALDLKKLREAQHHE